MAEEPSGPGRSGREGQDGEKSENQKTLMIPPGLEIDKNNLSWNGLKGPLKSGRSQFERGPAPP